MSKLWTKDKMESSEITDWAESFTVGNDYLLDNALLPYDIKASIAHARGLHAINVLSEIELSNLVKVLTEIKEAHENGNFNIERRHEDVHTAIEEYLIKKLGDTGKKIHTGRSRNDQVLTALRLYEKNELETLMEETLCLAGEFIKFARKHEFVPMPGYTHTQPAMLSSVGMWAASFAEMINSSANLLRCVQDMINYCPLGTAAGFGVNLNLPREMVSDLLGFKAPITVAMTAQCSRGKWETTIVHTITSVTAILAQFANDLIQYTSKEYGFFLMSDELTTGSSIMPQKRNQDVAELLRAKHHQIVSDEFMLHQLTMRLTSGYHRDLQLTKEPVIRSIETCKVMLEAGKRLIGNLSVDENQLKAKIYPEMLAADEANKLVMQGIPFREAYQKVSSDIDSLKVEDLPKLLKERTHLGATGNLGLAIIERHVKQSLMHDPDRRTGMEG